MLIQNKHNNETILKEEECKNTYIAGIMHDLKNPLLAQIRIFEYLIKKKNENDKTIETYKQLLSSSHFMLDMVLSLANTFKTENTKTVYNFDKCNLVDIVQESCKELTNLTNNREDFIFHIKSKAKIIKADKLQLRRVINNLISNAINYRKDNTEILVEINSNEENIEFTVTNQGYYIKPELQKEIFKKYVSASAKFNSMGTGLGLYLSKKIIIAHKGNMLINSTPEGINTFGFSLPKASHFEEKNKEKYLA